MVGSAQVQTWRAVLIFAEFLLMVAYFAAAVWCGWRYPESSTFRPILASATYVSGVWAVWFMMRLVYQPFEAHDPGWALVEVSLHLLLIGIFVTLASTLPHLVGADKDAVDRLHHRVGADKDAEDRLHHPVS